jgi:transcriptional regulator with XRE-family HTH domain
MMELDSPSVRERRLARELREARIGAQLAGTAVANATGWSTSKVSRIETGRIGISAADLDRLIELYDVSDEHAKYLRRLAPAARTRGWWEAYADSLSAGYAGLLRLESGSQALRSYCAVVPHPLLMTQEYIRHVVLATWQQPSPQEVDRRIRVCLRRQAVLEHNEPHPRLELSVVIDEAVLRRSVASRDDPAVVEVQVDQLNRLITAAAWPNVTLQVLPFAAGIPPVSAGSFSILESRATGGPDVIYLENKTRIFFVDAEKEVDRYARDYRLLTDMALPTAESVHFIQAIADDLARKVPPLTDAQLAAPTVTGVPRYAP